MSGAEGPSKPTQQGAEGPGKPTQHLA